MEDGVVTMPPGRTTFDVTREPLKVQLETFLDEHRAALRACLDGLTEEQARRSLVPSRTTLLGLVKHVTYAEKIWFGEAVTGRPRQEMGLPPSAADAFILTGEDTIESVRRAQASSPVTSRPGCALRAGRKSSSTPRWSSMPWPPNQQPPRAASGGGFGISSSPSTSP